MLYYNDNKTLFIQDCEHTNNIVILSCLHLSHGNVYFVQNYMQP